MGLEEKLAKLRVAGLDAVMFNSELGACCAIRGMRNRLGNVQIPEGFRDMSITEIHLNIGHLKLPNTMKEIRPALFMQVDGIDEITIGDKCERIASDAFYQCEIKKINLGKQIKEIGNLAFKESWLQEVNIPDSVEKLGEVVFSCCEKLRLVRLSDRIYEIPKKCFEKTSIEEISLYKIKKIDDKAFAGCKKLNRVEIGSKCKSIGDLAFYGCGLETLKIPDYCTDIGDHAFYDNHNLKSVYLGNHITNIPDNCFSDCINLESIHIDDNCKEIGLGAFRECRSIKEFRVPKEIKAIGHDAFRGCQVKRVFIPKECENMKEQFPNAEIQIV